MRRAARLPLPVDAPVRYHPRVLTSHEPVPSRYLPSGTRLGGWIVDWPLGEGASGVVYRCRAANAEGPPRALKLLRTVGDAIARARFAREVRVLGSLEHPSIVPLIEAGESEGASWLVMALAAGRPLAAVTASATVAVGFALDVCAQVAEALAYAHSRGVAHRDVKPGNVLVDAYGRAVLVDFGVAAAVEASRLTRVGDRNPTTPRYAPPEWWLGGPATPEKADVYALGVVLYELLAGRPAWADVPPEHLAEQKASGAPLDPGPGVPASIRALVREMTAATASTRPSAREVTARLPNARTDDPPPGSDPTLDAVPARAPSLPPDGRIGPYRILGELGRGGMGIVYRAERVDGGGPVALKWMLHGARGHERRFRTEIAALARLDHPTLLAVHDVGEHEGRLFYTMELVDGPDLATFLRERGLVSARVAIGWGIDLANALAFAHGQGIVHRDVKPGNVLLEHGRRVRLADFGLARELVADGTLTQAGEVLGTPRYMAPEQARGLPAGPAADIYALGAVLYELLSGRPYVTGEHDAQIRHQLLRGAAPRLDAVAAGVPAELALVVHKALAADPVDRYTDMGAFAADLARVAAGQRAVEARPSMGTIVRRALRRHRERLAVAGLLVAIGALGVGARSGLSAREEWRREEAAEGRLATVEETVRAALAAGDEGAAERAFRGFVELPENQGTRAIARAWLARADRLAGLDEGDAHRDALAHAWASARHDDDANQALVGLAASLARRHDWAGLGAAVQTMRERGVSTEASRALEAAREYSRRDFAAGSRFDRRDGIAPLLAALGRATRTAPDTVVVGNLDVDADGRAEILLHEDGRRLAIVRAGDLALQRREALTLPGGRHAGFPRPFQVSADLPLVLVWDTREAALYDVGGRGRPRELAHWPESQYKPTILADLDEDGVRELLVGTRAPGRHLVSVAPDAEGTWRVRAPHPASNQQNSAFLGLGWGDFDGDGRSELWQARGAFGAYDVRMLGRDGSGELALLGRRKLGDVQDGVVIRGPGGRRRMVVVRADVWPSRSGLPPETPFGEPRGIYALDWDGARFRTAWYLPTESECIDLQVADLDGDRLDDVAVNCGEVTVVARQLPDGGFVDATIAGARLVGAADMDGDGEGELHLVEPDGAAWIVGAGTDHLPVLPEPAEPAIRDDDPGVLRAEALVRMGLVAEGVGALEDEALQAPAGAARAKLRLRIGELQEQLGRADLAASSYLSAADAGALRVEALRGAARCFERALLHPRALDAVNALLAGDGLEAAVRGELEATRARLEERVGAPSVTLDFAEGLPDVFDVLDPLQAWHDPAEGALRVRQADDGVVARVPLTWDGRWLQIELDLTLERFEWAARLYVQLEPAAAGRDAWGAQVRAVGGAGNLTTAPGCSLTTDTPPALGWIPRDGPDWGDRVTVRIGVDASTGWGSCTWEGLPEHFQARQSLRPAPPPGDYVLVVRGLARDGVSVADAAVHRIVVRGATVRAAPAEMWPAARRALATQRPADALAELAGAQGPDAEILRIFALDEAGRWAEADRRFAALASGEGARVVRLRAPVLLRARGERFVTRLREAGGREWPGLLWTAWGPTVRHHPDDERWQAALMRDLGGVDAFPPSPELLSLLVARGRAWRLAGRLPLAELDLERARTLADQLGGGGDVDAALASALLELAAVRGAQGRRDDAFGLVEEAITRAPAPEVWADIAVHRAELASLHTLPGWERVRAATRIP